MDLILWRHAEAEDRREGLEDADRVLTHRGEKQAMRVAAWLDRVLPDGTRVLTSPARRCQQTALALGRKFNVTADLAHDRTGAQLLEAVHWPSARQPVLLVGHQPALGELVGTLLGIPGGSLPVRKGGAWWLRTRERAGDRQTVVMAVQSPDLL